MVSGDSFVQWDEEPASGSPQEAPQADIIPFPKNKHQFTPLEEPVPEAKSEEPPSNFLGTDMALMQREIAKEAEEAMTRMSAKKGYKSATELFVIKSKDLEGKSKIRFAATGGVLVDKKQA